MRDLAIGTGKALLVMLILKYAFKVNIEVVDCFIFLGLFHIEQLVTTIKDERDEKINVLIDRDVLDVMFKQCQEEDEFYENPYGDGGETKH